MKTLLFGASALLVLATLYPVQVSGSRVLCSGAPLLQQVSDTLDPAEIPADTVVVNEEEVWSETDGDEAVAPSDLLPEPVEDFCTPDYELMGNYTERTCEYTFETSLEAGGGISLNASIYVPEGLKKSSGFNQMLHRILGSTIYEGSDRDAFKLDHVDKMFEQKWQMVKGGYLRDMEGDMSVSYFYRTAVMPAWHWKAQGGLTTFRVDDEIYTGGAHGMSYAYCLTYSEAADSVIGLTDIFKEESLPAVFALISDKLQARTDMPVDEEVWPTVADMTPPLESPDPIDYAGAAQWYKGKYYPRPALTECGVVFSYAPYVKDCYAAGTVHIVLTYAEVAPYLRIKL